MAKRKICNRNSCCFVVSMLKDDNVDMLMESSHESENFSGIKCQGKGLKIF